LSKEIAQTIGGKRVWLLVALLAAIASLATLASSWNQASAASTAPGDVRLDQVNQQVNQPIGTLVLRHVDDAGNIIDDQDVNFNVVGSRHTACVFDRYVDGSGNVVYDPFDFGVNIPISFIDFENAGGPGGPPNSVSVLSFTADASDFPFGVTDGADADGASCFSWISTGAGDQQINLEIFAEESDGWGPAALQIGWGHTGSGNRSLIKEWNQLTDSEIFINGASQGEAQNVKLSYQLWQLPDGSWVLPQPIGIADYFHGWHQETNGTYRTRTAGTSLVGVLWEVSLNGCGYLDSLVTPGNAAFGPNQNAGANISAGGSASGQTILWSDEGDATTANYPAYDFTADNCRPGSKAVITITGTEPGPQGSSAGDSVTQTIEITFTAPLDQKRVLLAWVGQRVVLEVDWRLPPGDTGDSNPEEVGFCPFGGQESLVGIINYKRLSGNGGFVPGLDAVILGNDAWVFLTGGDDQSGDAPDDPQDACISRVLYESEKPGQEDIQVSWDPFFDIDLGGPAQIGQVNTTKVDIVLYYMKFESVKASLVTSVSKPSHNSSSESYADYAPGNPWDSRSDVTSTDWNVSKDLLVRFQVRGWFVNENPSGREQDYNEDADEFLPANRWVLPDDWARLAGGPRDPEAGLPRAIGTAEATRPHYDLLFDPMSSCPTLEAPTGPVKDGAACVVNAASNLPFVGPYSIVEQPALGVSGSISVFGGVYDNVYRNGDVNRWDAPMPAAELWVKIRGAGFIKQVLKYDVYYTGTPNGTTAQQDYPNPYYATHLPPSPYMEFAIKGGGYLWDTWGTDGPYVFWQPVTDGTSPLGLKDASVTSAQWTELAAIQAAYGDPTISRDMVIYTDNHGEGMVTANGDFKLDLSACETNLLEGGKRCNPGDKVGTSSISAIAEYPDITGKHPAIESNVATVNWIWGGYKDVKVYDDPNGLPQVKYIVFHAVDRDGFCDPANFHPGAVSLHPVLSGHANDTFNGNPAETVDFLIDAGEGIITHSALNGQVNLDGNRQFATGVKTFSTKNNDPATSGIIEFPHSRPGFDDECQAWVRVSNSLLTMADFYVVAHNDEGRIGFDRVVDFQNTASYTLSFRWSLITWAGADNIPVEAALKGTGANAAGNDIFDQVTAVYGWNAQGQDWLGFFPAGVSVPGANDLTSLRTGSAYWIAIKAPGPVTWTIATNVGS
jgi:hypothetical protein